MNPRKFRSGWAAFAAVSLVFAGCSSGGDSGASSEKVTLRWYCCLGTGEEAEQLEVEKRIVEEFNASHPDIEVELEVVTFTSARDTLATQLASGNGPDVVGPVGVAGAANFHGQWLDLGPLIEESGYDMSQYDSAAVELYSEDGAQTGIPFAVYPSAIFYKADTFLEAGLNEPPHTYGEPYVWPDGRESDWSFETLRDIALKLTVDENGRDATQSGFDRNKIVQYGFEPARDDLRYQGASFGPGSLDSGDGKTVEIPKSYAEAWKFFYDGMWEDTFIMTGQVFESEAFNGEGAAFFSGHVAMSVNFLWSTYGVAGAGDDWNLAVMPANGDTTTSPTSADTFRILESTEHPEEAFEFLSYLVDEASEDLLPAYNGMPARPEQQGAFFDALAGQFPNEVDWQVAADGVQFADSPHSEAPTPKYNETVDLLNTYRSRWMTTSGLDMDAELDDLTADVEAIWHE